jgi:hypothetical protein
LTKANPNEVDLQGGKVRHTHVIEVVFVDQVAGADGVAQVHIRLAERHGADRFEGRAELQQPANARHQVKRLDGINAYEW